MSMRSAALGLVLVVSWATVAFAQSPTPTPVDSNIAVNSYAQSRGVYAIATPSPCTVRGGNGCGGCYPAPIPGLDPTSELPKVDPEWSAIGTMITPDGDTTVPPLANPVLLKGTVALTKINIGGDFPGSHVTDDQNTFITPDPDFNGFLATGNGGSPSCPGEGCDKVEMELEIGKYPLFAWAGEGDRVTALGRWIFDCGHPDPDPMGGCSGSVAPCIVDADCPIGQTCTNPAPIFNYRAEMHPPQAIAVVRNKSVLKVPATQADVYISDDGGGAGDLCTVTHLASASSVLFSKACFQNHCSVTTSRSCKIDKDCAVGEKCIVFDSTLDTTKRVADVNGQNFEFDMPLPPPPVSPSPAILKIKTKSFKPRGGIMPKATFQPTVGPTPNLHVVIPMTNTLPSGKLPNVFAQRISASWKGDAKSLTHVLVKFTKLTVNNPLKDSIPSIPRQCLLASGGLTNKACATDADCLAGTCATATTKACHTDHDCPKKDFCAGGARCVGGVTPGWELFGQVNGDWVGFKKLDTIGAKAPFLAPPYVKPSPTPLIIPEKFTFHEYVPSDGSIHIATTGHSLNCIDTLYGANLKDALTQFGLTLGGACLAAEDNDPGRINITHTGPAFTDAPAGVTCTPPPPARPNGPTTCQVTSGNGDGGTCSITTDKLCASDADCPGTCSGSGVPIGPCLGVSDCKQCSIHTGTFCASNFDCPAGTCDNNANKLCHTHADCGGGSHCTIGTPETCGASAGASCDNIETCNGTCALSPATSCHNSGDCGVDGPCVKGGAFTLEYTIQVK